MVAHVYKHHLALDRAPFYCTLCLLRCCTKASLMNHVERYSRHRTAARQLGFPNVSRYLVENPSPAVLKDGVDFKEMPTSEACLFSPVPSSDVSDAEWDFIRPAASSEPSTTASVVTPMVNQPAVTPLVPHTSDSTPGRGLVSIQMTPEMLSAFLSTQPLAQTAGGCPTAAQPCQSVGQSLYVPSAGTTASAPQYVPTPITTRMTTAPTPTTLVPVSASATSAFSHQTRLQTPSPLLRSGQIAPSQSTPHLSVASENILPQLLGSTDDAEYDLGFGEDWLETPILDSRPSGPLESLCSEKTPSKPASAEATNNIKDASTEPASKRARVEPTTEVPTTVNPLLPDVIKSVEGIIEKSVKGLVEALDRNSRAVRCVDKTMGEIKDVMLKINRTVERMGDEQRRENERRWKDERETQVPDKTRAYNRSADESRRERKKENIPLKSVVNKK